MVKPEITMKLNMDTSEIDEPLEHSIRLVKELTKSINELGEALIWVGQSLKLQTKEDSDQK
jgi:hypothetical protein